MAGERANAVVLIDGPSGSGKSTLADELVAAWPGESVPVLVRLDDIYPGWNGLDAAVAHVTESVLLPRAAGRPAAWQRWDWAAGRAAEWHPVDPSRPLIVEGCGTLARANVLISDVRVWLEADNAVRKRRALARDGATFGDHWGQWQDEWEAYCSRETPERWAGIRLFSPDDDPSRD
ncbi:MAG TPA: ATP-binding protein [Glaciibacter sp.]|nr:ATP-binding protein [Glaciibacter sp.]